MRKLFVITSLVISAQASASPASSDSVERLLVITKSESLIESMYGGMEQTLRQSLNQAMQGRQLNSDQQKVFDSLPAKFVASVREEMSWEKMKPMFIKIYQESFEQEEIDGLLAFYLSPSGQAYINKMPMVMRKSIALSQSLMQSIMPKMTSAMKDAMRDAKLSN